MKDNTPWGPRATTIAAAAAALSTLSGCRSGQNIPLAARPALSEARAPFAVSLTIAPLPIRSLDLKAFTVRLADGSGRPVTGAHVTVQLQMPSMDMGRNGFPAVEAGPGVYVGHGRFTMMGGWNAVVTVTKGRARVVRSFPLTVD